jgi:hypothetical protein
MTAPPTPDEMHRADLVISEWEAKYSCEWHPSARADMKARFAAALSTTAARAEARYREALAPFADAVHIVGKFAPDHKAVTVQFTARDLRRAAAILAQTTPQET